MSNLHTFITNNKLIQLVRLSMPLLLLALIGLFLASCPSVAEKTISSDNLEAVSQQVADSKLTDEEKSLYIRGIMRAEFSGIFTGEKTYSVESKTVQQVISEQREFEAKQKAEEEARRLAEQKAREKYRILIEQLRSQVQFIALEKVSHPANYSAGIGYHAIEITFEITNNSKKAIRGIEGDMKFYDIFDNLIKQVTYLYKDEIIEPTQSEIWSSYLKLNRFMDDDMCLFNTDLADMVIVFEPSQIVFADGEKMKADRPESLDMEIGVISTDQVN